MHMFIGAGVSTYKHDGGRDQSQSSTLASSQKLVEKVDRGEWCAL